VHVAHSSLWKREGRRDFTKQCCHYFETVNKVLADRIRIPLFRKKMGREILRIMHLDLSYGNGLSNRNPPLAKGDF
jgi:hypothetical protein